MVIPVLPHEAMKIDKKRNFLEGFAFQFNVSDDFFIESLNLDIEAMIIFLATTPVVPSNSLHPS